MKLKNHAGGGSNGKSGTMKDLPMLDEVNISSTFVLRMNKRQPEGFICEDRYVFL
jgi:hypothetical protein